MTDTPLHRTALIDRIAQGFEPRYLLFWGCLLYTSPSPRDS